MEQEHVKELLSQADQFYAQGDLEQAREAYEDVLDADPNVAWAYSRLGAICAQAGELAEAEEMLQKALELDPKLPQAHSNLGNLYYAQGAYENALAKYKEAVALNPDNAVFHENLHAAYKKLGKYSEAVGALKQAHKLGREVAKSEAKERMSDMKASMKGRFGCLGTSLISVLVLIISMFILF